MVEFRDVSVTYNTGVDALNNVDLVINDGDFAFVVGPSGAGKSTMIKLILREIESSEGSVRVNGYDLGRIRKKDIPKLRRTIGFVFQDFRLIQSMTVYENIAFVLRVIDAPRTYIKKRVEYVIGLVGLEGKEDAYPDELSGGEMQRCAIARALVNDPELIIADEPTGNIDPELSYEIVELLKQINNMGTTILMVTHEHDLVRHFGGRIINVNKGSVTFDNVISGDAASELLTELSAEEVDEIYSDSRYDTYYGDVYDDVEETKSRTGTKKRKAVIEMPAAGGIKPKPVGMKDIDIDIRPETASEKKTKDIPDDNDALVESLLKGGDRR